MNANTLPSSLTSAELEVTADDEIQANRSRALLQLSSTDICAMDPTALAALQSVLGHGSEFGRWQTPRRWFPTGTISKRDVNLQKRIIALLPSESLRSKANEPRYRPLVMQAVKLATCYLLVVRMGPAGVGRKRFAESLDTSFVAEIAYSTAPVLFTLALRRWLEAERFDGADTKFLSLLQEEDIASLSKHRRANVRTECRRMQLLQDRGWWTNPPEIDASTKGTTPVAGDKVQPEPEEQRDPHLPLPDDYVSEMGLRSLWLIESLAPNLLALTQSVVDIWRDTNDGSNSRTVANRRRRLVTELLTRWEWKDTHGVPIQQPPFTLRLSRAGDKRASKKRETEAELHWPPRTLSALLGLCGNVQHAHLFVVSMSTAGRKAETLDLRRSCVEYASDGLPYATGRTFKLVRKHEGELRDWVLPDLAVKSIEQQVRLVNLVESIGKQNPDDDVNAKEREVTDHLWVQVSGGALSDRTQPLLHLDTAMLAYAKALGMDQKPGGQKIRPHRFRKTVGRLVALALTQAPKILMDVFGHKSIEMTLYYILTDKSLQAEIEQVGRELRVMRAVEAVEAIVAAEDASGAGLNLGSYGGPAALMVGRAIQVQRERTHQRGEQWGAESVRELAEILTLQGKAWEVVREGVVCTKLPGTESGPCNKSKGRPEPSHCQSNCNHRLEESFLREDVDKSIEYSVREFEVALQDDDVLMQAMWAGQIRAHLPRFADLQEKWKLNPTVQRVLVASNDEHSEVAA
jgi:integrase